MKKKNEFSYLFGHNIISNGLYQAIKNNIVAKNTTGLVLLFHKNITKLVLIWPNMSQKNFKVLTASVSYIDIDLLYRHLAIVIIVNNGNL